MCNLYRLDTPANQIAGAFEIKPDMMEWQGDYVAPGKPGVVILGVGGERKTALMRWGFSTRRPRKTAPKAGQPNYVTEYWTNARNLDRPMWRSWLAQPTQRCLVPFTRFSEPKAQAARAEARDLHWWFTVPESRLPCFAGVWKQTSEGLEYAFLTCEPNALVEPLHPKAMPVILLPDDYDRWLTGSIADALALQAPFPSQLMAVA